MAFGTRTTSDFLTVDADFEFFIASSDAIVLALNPRETVSFLITFDAAGTTDDLEVQVLQGHRLSTGNGLDGGTGAADVELNTTADGFSTDDDMNGRYLIMTSGGERGEGRLITDSVAADDGVILDHDLSGTPSAAETYDLYTFHVVSQFLIDSATPTEDIPHHQGISVNAVSGQFVAVRVRRDGATDAHRAVLSFQVDGVSV